MSSDLKIKKLADYQPDDRNPNRGTVRGYGALEHSLRQYGAGRSLLADKNGKLIAGNKTAEKAAELGIEDVIEVETNGRQIVVVRRTDLDLDTDAAARELSVADNRVGELSLDWSPDVLAALASETDLSHLFRPDELAALLASVDAPEAGGGGDDFDATPDDGPTRCKVGDLWVIGGKHRLVCGDCTDPAVVARLMGGERADCVIADLPYGTTGCSWDTVIPFPILWGLYSDSVIDNGAIVLTASQPFTSALVSSNFPWFKCSWVWNKKLAGNFLLADKQPLKIHEDVCIFSRGTCPYKPQMRQGVKRLKGGDGKSKLWNIGLVGSVNDTYYPVSIIEIGNTDRINIEHPTQKPIELFTYLLETYSNTGDLVWDNTIGSGTTLIAAHRTGRRCYGIDVEPKWIDVCIARAEAEGLSVERSE